MLHRRIQPLLERALGEQAAAVEIVSDAQSQHLRHAFIRVYLSRLLAHRTRPR